MTRFHAAAVALFLLGAPGAAGAMARRAPATEGTAAQKKDYLSDLEADKIRDADTPNERVKLFLNFAADRLKKFRYELSRTLPESRRNETLNGLLNSYTGCVDDAADVITLAVEKQQEIRAGVKDMEARAKEYLSELQEIESKGGKESPSYKVTLDDAIEATEDAIRDAEDAEKEMAPPPVRRKP